MATVAYKCPNCASPLVYEGEKMKCPACASEFEVEEIEARYASQANADVDFDLPTQGYAAADVAQLQAYNCKTCGAELITESTTTATECPFNDVEAGAYYYKAVLWAVEKGITKGTSETEFSPFKDCTRAQVVTFLWRAQNSPESTAEASFEDVLTGQFYTDAVAWAVENGITNGLDDTTFGVNATCNRAQVVTFLFRAQAE